MANASAPSTAQPATAVLAPAGLDSRDKRIEDAAEAPRQQVWAPGRLELQGTHASGYSWCENGDEMEVVFVLPAGATKASVVCEIRSSFVRLLFQGTHLLDGELAGTVHADGSAWFFECAESNDSSPRVVLSLMKRDKRLWGYAMQLDREKAEEDDVSPLRDGPADGDEPMASSLQRPGVDFL